MTRPHVVIVFLCALACSPLPAQTAQVADPPRVIPQARISDPWAYLLWLQAAAIYPGKVLRPIGLSPRDERAAFDSISAFESVFMAHSNAYDSGAETRGQFERTRDELVENARKKLAATLSPEGMSRLNSFVLSVKKTPPQVLEQ